MKQEDAEITSLRSAARLMRSKTKIPTEYQTPDARSDINQLLRSAARLMRSKTKIPTEYQTPAARSDINQRNNHLGRNSYQKKTKDKNRGEHFKLINILR